MRTIIAIGAFLLGAASAIADDFSLRAASVCRDRGLTASECNCVASELSRGGPQSVVAFANRLRANCPNAYRYFATGGIEPDAAVARGGQGIPTSTGSAAREIEYYLGLLERI